MSNDRPLAVVRIYAGAAYWPPDRITRLRLYHAEFCPARVGGACLCTPRVGPDERVEDARDCEGR